MSVLQNPVQRVSPAAQAGLMRLLLQCRFDFQHRYWNLPASETGSGDSRNFSTGQEALLPLLNAVISDFSAPSRGGANTSKTKTRRVGTRHSFQRPLGKIGKTQVRCD
ncbi:MAG: hypothetical protein ABSH15_06190 [Verrucomicrobiota bacterium]|jgi:hypothetical protein